MSGFFGICESTSLANVSLGLHFSFLSIQVLGLGDVQVIICDSVATHTSEELLTLLFSTKVKHTSIHVVQVLLLGSQD